MILFQRLTLAAIGLAGMAAASLYGGDGVCFHCEEIREDNKVNHKNYEYYEDYLKDQQKTVKTTPPVAKPVQRLR